MVYETSISAPIFGLRRDMNRLLGEVLNRNIYPNRAESRYPAADIVEDAETISIALELPGVSQDDVNVTTEHGVLTVRGEKRVERKEGADKRYHLMERTYGSFLRAFQLPKGVDETKIGAQFTDGILTITFPKAALPQPRKIEVTRPSAQNENQVQGEGHSQSAPAVG